MVVTLPVDIFACPKDTEQALLHVPFEHVEGHAKWWSLRLSVAYISDPKSFALVNLQKCVRGGLLVVLHCNGGTVVGLF